MRKTMIVGFAAVMFIGLTVTATEPARWLNVNVVEHGDDDETVNLRVPVSMVRSLVEAISADGLENGVVELDLDDIEIDWPKLMAAIRSAPDGDFVTVKAEDARVVVSKKAGTIRIHVSETAEPGDEGETVDVTVPAAVLDSLRFDGDGGLDLKPLLASLQSLPGGDLVTVRSTDADVRIWIE